jgi:hypothetical protein
VTTDGRIGPLRLDVSDRGDVVDFAGRPDSEVRGRYEPNAPYDALGYGCGGRRAVRGDGLPLCATVFYVDGSSDRLEEFYTADRRYSGPAGVRAGDGAKAAARRLHRPIPMVGCLAAFLFQTRGARLALVLDEPKDSRVAYVVLVSRLRAPGVFDCIDS